MTSGGTEVFYHSRVLQELWTTFHDDKSLESVHFNTLNARLRKISLGRSFSLSISLKALHDVGLIRRSTSPPLRSNHGRWILTPGVMKNLDDELLKLARPNRDDARDEGSMKQLACSNLIERAALPESSTAQNQTSSVSKRTRQSTSRCTTSKQVGGTPKTRKKHGAGRPSTPARFAGSSSRVTRSQHKVGARTEHIRDPDSGRRSRTNCEVEEPRRALRNDNEGHSGNLVERGIRNRDPGEEMDRLIGNNDFQDRRKTRSQANFSTSRVEHDGGMKAKLDASQKEIEDLRLELSAAKRQLQDSQRAQQNSEDTSSVLSQNYAALKSKMQTLTLSLKKIESTNSAHKTRVEQQKRKAIEIIASIGE